MSDKSLIINGYKPDFEKLEYGLFFFTHNKDGCFSTIAVETKEFTDLYTGKIFKERKTGTKDCKGLCLKTNDLSPCNAECEAAFVRGVIQLIKQRHNK